MSKMPPPEIPHGGPNCAAYGCPLAGSFGRASQWFCFVHFSVVGDLQTITTAIRRKRGLVDLSREIRRWGLGAADLMRDRIVAAGREDLLPGPRDCPPARPGKPSAALWLARVESELIRAAEDAVKGVTPPAAQPMGATEAVVLTLAAHYRSPAEKPIDDP